MGWRERIFGSRDKLRNIDKAERKVEKGLGTLWDTLQGNRPPASKNCPVCNSANPMEAEICWKCQNVFE